MGKSSQKPLFRPFRALGYITDSVPFSVQRRGKETFVTVSVGKAWQVYNCGKLTLTLVGPQLPGSIRALSSKGDLTFAAVGNVIVECKRVHKSGVYLGHQGPVLQLMVLGDFLISLGADKQLLVWTIGERDEPKYRVTLPAHLTPTCMAHPDTYVNKLVVGTVSGELLLLNFTTGTVLYTFKGWGCETKCVTSSPALDVVGVALADGRAVLHNLKYDETVAVFANAAGVGLASGLMLGGVSQPGIAAQAAGAAGGGTAACTWLSFRTGAGAPLMAAGGGSGVITLWDLENKRLHSVLQDAHDAPVVAVHFFAGEPLLMSAGADNAIKHWVLDSSDPKPRMLRFRSGHAAPPTVVHHYGEGLRLLSAGSDRAFRVFSTIQDQQSRELSQKHTKKRAKKLKLREAELKLGRVTCLDACTVRERDWSNVITGHEGDTTAYVWRLAHFTLGEHELRPPEPAPVASKPGDRRNPPAPVPSGGRLGGAVTAVCLSSCGNYGLVGSAYGRIDRYNMQSGIHRAVYGRKGNDPEVLLAAHDGAVTGIRVDSCNKLMVSVGLDGFLRIWDFKAHQVRTQIALGSPATQLVLGTGSGLAAVACDDHVLRCYDIEAGGRLVRRFTGHRDRITSVQLSSDNRWLLTASMDGTLRTWDVPAAQCLQVLRLGAPVTSLSLSPAQDLLATCHVNRRGIYLWSNQAVFGNPADFTHSDQPVNAILPSIAEGLADGTTNPTTSNGQETDAIVSASQLLAGALSSDEDEGYEIPDSAEETGSSESDEEGEGAEEADKPPETGAPQPLAPSLVTLSLLPRAQWHSLMHLEAIKARNKPIQPPKKPEAAPFFLPTVPTLSGNPVFDPTAATTTETDQETDGAAAGAGGSRILRSAGHAGHAGAGGDGYAVQGPVSEFVRLLRSSQEAGDWTSFSAYLRGLSPASLDREVRALQMLSDVEDTSPTATAAVADVAGLLEAVDAELVAGTNFEFMSALLQLVLQVHGDAIMERPELKSAARRVQKRLKPIWNRLDNLLGDVRCMAAYFGNLQG